MTDLTQSAQDLLDEARRSEDGGLRVYLLEKARQISPTNFEILQELGKGYLRLNRLDPAESALQAALAIHDDGWTHLYLGNLEYQRGDVGAAEAAFLRADNVLGDDPAPLWCLGDLRRETGDQAAAEKCYREALSRDPSCIQATARLGRLLIETGRKYAGERLLRDAGARDDRKGPPFRWAKQFGLL